MFYRGMFLMAVGFGAIALGCWSAVEAGFTLDAFVIMTLASSLALFWGFRLIDKKRGELTVPSMMIGSFAAPIAVGIIVWFLPGFSWLIASACALVAVLLASIAVIDPFMGPRRIKH